VATARQAFEWAEVDFERAARELGLGGADVAKVLAARERRSGCAPSSKCGQGEDGDPAILGRYSLDEAATAPPAKLPPTEVALVALLREARSAGLDFETAERQITQPGG
jgi:hypothetical protein